jgi:hypothetical protein
VARSGYRRQALRDDLIGTAFDAERVGAHAG